MKYLIQSEISKVLQGKIRSKEELHATQYFRHIESITLTLPCLNQVTNQKIQFYKLLQMGKDTVQVM